MRFDWKNHKHDFTFTTITELYIYDEFGGYSPAGYAKQNSFISSPACPCASAPLLSSQPPLIFDLDYLRPLSPLDNCTICGGGSPIYVPKYPGSTLENVVFTPTGFPVVASFNTGRTFLFSNCTDLNYTMTTWTVPKGCACGTPIDIVLVLDRSSSISAALFVDEKNFVVKMINAFDTAFSYGELGLNLGMTNFHTLVWDGPISLNHGNASLQVKEGAAALACAPDPQCVVFSGPGTCCGSGTCISCGIVQGADMLASQASTAKEREDAAKVIIVFTDGYHNRMVPKNGLEIQRDASGQIVGIPGTSTEALTADLQWAVDYAVRKVPKVTFYAVGTGAYRLADLLVITSGNNSKILANEDWSELPNFVQPLVEKTCSGAKVDIVGESCCDPTKCSVWCKRMRAAGAILCNDGNSVDGDGCDSTCLQEDGFICSSPPCISVCGDGMIRGIEACDDGNSISGDGCSAFCRVEVGYFCDVAGEACFPICGDGRLIAGEACDDGNLISGDGCSKFCTVEEDYTFYFLPGNVLS